MDATVLVTGGAGFIGSHTVIELVACGARVVIADDYSNSSPAALDAIRQLTGEHVEAVRVDLTDAAAIGSVFDRFSIQQVIHFAGLKAVGESVADPLRYYRTNLDATFNLLDAMAAHDVYDLVFSSSATVYAPDDDHALDEGHELGPTNPYGRTKWMIEHVLRDLAASDDRWRITALRYFNPVGAHASGDLGEDPRGTPNNLVPYVMQVAVGRRPELVVFGDDYDTIDGTGVRDYIHVVDLATGHLRAIDRLSPGFAVYNLGRGDGATVLQVVEAARTVTGTPIPYRVSERRSGDIARSVADPSAANDALGWAAVRDLDEMLADAWRWQSRHPNGFAH